MYDKDPFIPNIYKYIFAYIYLYVYMYIYMYTCIHKFIHAYISIYIHICAYRWCEEMYDKDPYIPRLPFNLNIYQDTKKLTVGYYLNDGVFTSSPGHHRYVYIIYTHIYIYYNDCDDKL
jgi:hypothetical protein